MSDRTSVTALGALAILFWGSTIAFSRGLTEELGTLTAAASIYVLGGALACASTFSSRARRAGLAALPRAYWLACGSLFVIYTVCFYLAIGLARGRQQVVEVGLINYLWPTLTLALSVPILGARARWTIVPGVAVACAGVVLATFATGPIDLAALAANAASNRLVYALAFVAAVAWGFYNNLARRLASDVPGNGVAAFILVSGLVLAGLRALHPEPSRFGTGLALQLAYMALFPTFLAYDLWDTAMRRGHIVLLASLSYLTPLLSTLISCGWLGLPFGPRLVAACALVIAGAWTCSRSVVMPETREPAAPRGSAGSGGEPGASGR